MDKTPVNPCPTCKQPESTNCKNCKPWREWYLYRQSLINAKAAQLGRSWRYKIY